MKTERICRRSSIILRISTSFQGAAPLHHTLLCKEEYIGLTLQTLDEEKFDQGQILAQSEYPGFKHFSTTVPQLLEVVSSKGAEMLVKGLRDLVYVPPRQEVGWYATRGPIHPVRRAPKISPEDRHIDWNTWPAERILRTHRVIGPLWNNTVAFKEGKSLPKRVIWSSGFKKYSGHIDAFPDPGHPIVRGLQTNTKSVLIKTCDGIALEVHEVKVEGASSAPARQAFKSFGMVDYPSDPSRATEDFVTFRERLT